MVLQTINTLTRAIDYSQLKNDTLLQNIANVDTPGYQRKSLPFKNYLSEELNSLEAKRTNKKHLLFTGIKHSPLPLSPSSYNHNQNNVDIDKEMTQLSENQIYYEAMVDRLNGEFGKIRQVIRGGK